MYIFLIIFWPSEFFSELFFSTAWHHNVNTSGHQRADKEHKRLLERHQRDINGHSRVPDNAGTNITHDLSKCTTGFSRSKTEYILVHGRITVINCHRLSDNGQRVKRSHHNKSMCERSTIRRSLVNQSVVLNAQPSGIDISRRWKIVGQMCCFAIFRRFTSQRMSLPIKLRLMVTNKKQQQQTTTTTAKHPNTGRQASKVLVTIRLRFHTC